MQQAKSNQFPVINTIGTMMVHHRYKLGHTCTDQTHGQDGIVGHFGVVVVGELAQGVQDV